MEDLEEFVAGALPRSPARVLEVGCGGGELATRLASMGYSVVGIDPEAPEGDLFRRVSLEDFDETGFEAVVANRSLHHVNDLARGVRKIHSLLAPHGLIVVCEFVWDRMDRPTAEWYEDVAERSGGLDHRIDADRLLEGWAAEHDGHHGEGPLLAELGKWFREISFSPTPYIARYYLDDLSLEVEEEALIAEGSVRALGFRYVGRARGVRTE